MAVEIRTSRSRSAAGATYVELRKVLYWHNRRHVRSDITGSETSRAASRAGFNER